EVIDIDPVIVECHDDPADDGVDLRPFNAVKRGERGLDMARNAVVLRPVYPLDLDVRTPIADPPSSSTATRRYGELARHSRQHGRCLRDHPCLWSTAYVAATDVLASLTDATGLLCVLFPTPALCRDRRADGPADDAERAPRGDPAPPDHVPGRARREANVRYGNRGHRYSAPVVGCGRPLRSRLPATLARNL